MKNPRMIAIPGLMLASALVLTGCGDKDQPDAMSPSPTGAMMDDGTMDDGTMDDGTMDDDMMSDN